MSSLNSRFYVLLLWADTLFIDGYGLDTVNLLEQYEEM